MCRPSFQTLRDSIAAQRALGYEQAERGRLLSAIGATREGAVQPFRKSTVRFQASLAASGA
jgi:hypothetical protein